MKKAIYLFFLFWFMFEGQVRAVSYDVSQLPIVVRVVPEWMKDYPTVINNWDGKFITTAEGELPPLLAVITSINGKDTKGMAETEFNELLLTQSQSNISYLIKKEGKNISCQCTIHYHPSIYWAEGIVLNDPENLPDNITLRNLKGSSVFTFNTFAYKKSDINDFNEEEMLKAAGRSLSKLGFAQIENEENADMILTLSQGKDSYNGIKMVMNIYDGKRFREGIQEALWAIEIGDIQGNIKNAESNIRTALYKYTNNFPFDLPSYSNSITTLGVAFKNEAAVSSGAILEVLQGSDAYIKGLRSGDAIIGAYAGTAIGTIIKTRRYYFKPNKKDGSANWGVNLFLLLPILPKYTKNKAYNYLTHSGYYSANQHFKVRQVSGQTVKMDAPFYKSEIIFKYIK